MCAIFARPVDRRGRILKDLYILIENPFCTMESPEAFRDIYVLMMTRRRRKIMKRRKGLENQILQIYISMYIVYVQRCYTRIVGIE